MNVSRIFRPALIALLALMPLSGHAALEEVVNYEALEYSPANVAVFIRHLEAERSNLLKELQTKYAEKPEKIAQNADLGAFDKILSDARGLAGSKGDVAAATAFTRLQRVHYSVLADLDLGEVEPKLKRKIRFTTSTLGGPLILNVPQCYGPEDRIGERKARKEAAHLFKPGSKAPVSLDELAQMTPVEISRLEPGTDHPAISPVAPGDHYKAFLDDMVAMIRKQSPKLARFDPSYARRVLFFDDIDKDATSPKIGTKDRFGLKWKLKWGDEVHTDVAMSRLYIDLGATCSDLKYYSGPGESILVLDPPSKESPDAVHAFHELSSNLLASRFQFHADRYLLAGPVLKDKQGRVLGTGIVDQAMIDRESLDPKYIGSYFVTFKECQLSLYNPAIRRLGGSPLSRLGAVEDRVARGSLIFNCWIKHKDMKDDNSRVAYLFNPRSGEFDRHVEYQSDLGNVLGSWKSAGELNSFQTSFVTWQATTINFEMHPLYIPRSWTACTWSDARWMALRIARLTRADYERIFAECGWPVFCQKAAIERLIARRNELIHPFRLDLDGIEPIPCDPKFDFEATTKNGKDFPVKNGKIVKDSALVQELETTVHPEGLADVLSRKKD